MLRFKADAAYAAVLRQQFEAAYARIRTPADAVTHQQPAASVCAGGAAAYPPQQQPATARLEAAPQQPPPAPARSARGGAEAPCRDPLPERADAPLEPHRAGRTARLQVFPPSGTSAPGGRREAAPPVAPMPRVHAAAQDAAELPRRTRKRAATEDAERTAIAAVVASTPRRSAGAEACAGPASPPPTASFKPPAPSAAACAAPSSPCSEATAAAAVAVAPAAPPPRPPPAAKLPRRALIQVSSPAPAAPAAAGPADGAAEALQLGACSVCWEGICVAAPPGSGMELCELRPCEHAYHAACIQPRLAAQNTCPQCRVRVRARWGAARGLEPVAEADTFVQQLHTWTGRMPYDDTVCQVR